MMKRRPPGRAAGPKEGKAHARDHDAHHVRRHRIDRARHTRRHAAAAAASFDCSRARAADEITVCRNATLSALDSEMGGLWYAWSRVPMLMGGSGARADEAREFLRRRRACGRGVGCIERLYRARIAELRQGIDGAMREFGDFVQGREG